MQREIPALTTGGLYIKWTFPAKYLKRTTIAIKLIRIVGRISAQSNFQSPLLFGHYMFTGGNCSLTARTVGVYDIGSLLSNNLELQSYEAAATSNFTVIRRAGDYAILKQNPSSPEIIIADISDWQNISIVNTIDIPSSPSYYHTDTSLVQDTTSAF